MAEQQEGSQVVVLDSTNWSEWTYALALSAVTGDEVDLRALSRARWFVFDPTGIDQPGGMAEVGYQAFGTQYFGASIDHRAIDSFEAGVDTLNAVAGDLAAGVRGAMDLQTLASLKGKVADLETFLAGASARYRRLALDLDSAAVDASGKAAHVVQARLDGYAGKLELWSDRLVAAPGLPLSTAVQNAWTDLDNFRRGMAAAWYSQAGAGIRNRIRDTVDAEVRAIRDHLVSRGVVIGTPEYTFDKWNPSSNPTAIVTPDMVAQLAQQ